MATFVSYLFHTPMHRGSTGYRIEPGEIRAVSDVNACIERIKVGIACESGFPVESICVAPVFWRTLED